MFDFLRGSVYSLDPVGGLTLEVNGVGYRLRVSERTRRTIPLDGKPILIHCRQVIREDAWDLFGFCDPAERTAFDLLTSVQGVGPSVAMGLLSEFAIPELKAILLRKDATRLKRAKGVGPKLAERIVVELVDKVDRIPAPLDGSVSTGPGDETSRKNCDEARQGLLALGFAQAQVSAIIQGLDTQGKSSEEILRLALLRLRSL